MPVMTLPEGAPATLREAFAHIGTVTAPSVLDMKVMVLTEAAAMALYYKTAEGTEISGIVRGSNGNLIAYQGDPAQDHAKRSTVDQAQAKDAPADKSLSDLGQLQQGAAPRQEQPQQQRAVGM